MLDVGSLLSLEGRVALVTGGSEGIGRSIAEHFVGAGAAICLVARGEAALDATVSALCDSGGRAIAVCGSIADPAILDACVARCVEELGALDILVNNAATQGPLGMLTEIPPGGLAEVFHVNLETPLLCARAAWEAWMAEHGGSIINISSGSGFRPRDRVGAYGMTKAALNHVTRQLAVELAPGVRVNAIAPGLIMTPWALQLRSQEYRDAAAAKRPLGRLGVPADIGAVALFLASDASAYITGHILPVEGGDLLTSQ